MPALRFVSELLTFAALIGVVYMLSVLGPGLHSMLMVAQV